MNSITFPDDHRLLVPREEARLRYLGGASNATLYRLEKRGALKPIKLTKSNKARVFYRRNDLLALISDGEVHEAQSATPVQEGLHASRS